MLAVGRALVQQPLLLLLDEPSLGLAPVLSGDVFATLAEIARNGTSLLLAEQNVRLAATLADRAIILDRGVLSKTCSGETLREDPASIALSGLLQASDRRRP